MSHLVDIIPQGKIQQHQKVVGEAGASLEGYLNEIQKNEIQNLRM